MRLLAEVVGIVAGSLAIAGFVARHLANRRRLRDQAARKELPPGERME